MENITESLLERNNRKIYMGKVVADGEDKTIKVEITTYRKHKMYSKRVVYTKKFTAHDEENQAKIGDVVKIMATRPLSKTKRYRLLEIVETAVVL